MKKLSIGALLLLLAGAVFCFAGVGSEAPRATTVPLAKLKEAKSQQRQGIPAAPPPTMPAEVSAQIGRAMGGYLVACDIGDRWVRDIEQVTLPTGTFIMVPAPEGALPLVQTSPEIRTSGAFRWEGASDTETGRCVVDEGLVAISGEINVPQGYPVEICGVRMDRDEQGQFKGEIPAGVSCGTSVMSVHPPCPSLRPVPISNSAPARTRIGLG